jgi:polyribonucleotide 5'-hydroxyl-kinase
MSAYANLHIALEQMRVRALRAVHGSPISDNDDYEDVREDGPSSQQHGLPPRVLILGPEHSGKTTVTKILANYAVRAGQDWAPLVVNVDPSEVRNCPPFTVFSSMTYDPLHPLR